jgi:hypothetical protein
VQFIRDAVATGRGASTSLATKRASPLKRTLPLLRPPAFAADAGLPLGDGSMLDAQQSLIPQVVVEAPAPPHNESADVHVSPCASDAILVLTEPEPTSVTNPNAAASYTADSCEVPSETRPAAAASFTSELPSDVADLFLSAAASVHFASKSRAEAHVSGPPKSDLRSFMQRIATRSRATELMLAEAAPQLARYSSSSSNLKHI